MDRQPPMDFDEGLYLPPDSFEPDMDEPQVFGIRAVRYTDHIKEYEVQLGPDSTWTWVAAISLPASTLVYEFERDRLHFDRLDMMVQTDFVPPNNDEDEEETKSEAGGGEGDDLSRA
ncbi:unnamed protein product [Aphanomyces euteiches]